MKYPPGMSIVKNSPGGNVSYKGSIVDVINYSDAGHFKLKCIIQLNVHYNLQTYI